MEVIGIIISVLFLLLIFVYIPVVIIRWVVKKFQKLKTNDTGNQKKIYVITKKRKESSTNKTDVKSVSNSIDVSNPKNIL